MRRPDSGFTILELMTALLVTAVFMVLAVPSFRDLMDKSRLRGATDDIVSLLNLARTRAVKLQRDVNFSVDTSSWCAGARSAGDPASIGDPVSTGSTCNCKTSPSVCLIGTDKALVTASDYSGVKITADDSVKISSGGITFNSKAGTIDLGSLPTNPIVTVTSPTGKYSTQISVSPLGQTNVCVKNSKFVSGYPSC